MHPLSTLTAGDALACAFFFIFIVPGFILWLMIRK